MSEPRLEGCPVALVTGSTRGIGWACARRFAEAGYAVIINGVSDEAAMTARAAELGEEFGVPTLAIRADAGDEAQVAACYQAIFKKLRRLDVLVNNAGVLADGKIGMVPGHLLQRALAVNAAGSFYHLQSAARLMGRHGGGAIVNLTSIMGVRGAPGASAYAASKAAIVGLTLSAAKELGPQNIRVNAVAPGMIETDMLSGLKPAVIEERRRLIPLGRLGTADEVARTVLFLAEAPYITGQVLGVDGGMGG
ncbi:MAG TPA: SDR family oxidoreductase [Aliidongia sp.]|nr:SDR family oxidoreductase [Aliidongia sp.]